MKLPAIQFYPADWRKDPGVQALDYFDRGVWFEILCLMHESSERGKLLLNGEPMPDDALARVLGLDNQTLTKVLTTLLRFGVASRDQGTGALINRRMVKDENLRQKRAECGKKGGNPALLKQKTTKQRRETKPKDNQGVNQIPTPSSSSSTSTSEVKKEGRADKPLDPRVNHPAIQAVWKTRGKYPLKDLWDMIIETVGDSPDLGHMKQCWVKWRGRGFNSENYGWLTDWYVNGEQPDTGRQTASQRNVSNITESLKYLEGNDKKLLSR